MTVVENTTVPWMVASGTSVHAAVDLSRRGASDLGSPEMAAALDEIGDPTGETWLHLLGLCLELDEPRTIDQLIDHIAAMDPLRFRQVLLGLSAWSWRSIVGADTIEAAAAGDTAAADRLLGDDRYYGRVAAAALRRVLPLDAAETQGRFVAALTAYRELADLDSKAAALEAAVERVEMLVAAAGWVDAVESLTGYRYVPEPEARGVAVMPHLAGDGVTLAQHHDMRLIVYGEDAPLDGEQRIVVLGKALSDPARVQILAQVAAEPAQLGDLVAATGLTRSTVHHHLRQLRSAGLLAVEGNARAYRYRVNRRGGRDAIATLQSLLMAAKEGTTS